MTLQKVQVELELQFHFNFVSAMPKVYTSVTHCHHFRPLQPTTFFDITRKFLSDIFSAWSFSISYCIFPSEIKCREEFISLSVSNTETHEAWVLFSSLSSDIEKLYLFAINGPYKISWQIAEDYFIVLPLRKNIGWQQIG